MIHLKFEEQTPTDAAPCVCWEAGYAILARPELYAHPNEWREGLRAAGEYQRDI